MSRACWGFHHAHTIMSQDYAIYRGGRKDEHFLHMSEQQFYLSGTVAMLPEHKNKTYQATWLGEVMILTNQMAKI